MSSGLTPALLVKSRGGAAALGMAAGAATPLFRSIGADHAGALGIDGRAPSWSRVAADDDSPAKLWEQCHKLVRDGMGLTGSGVTFAEPDLVQPWAWSRPEDIAFGLAASCSSPKPPSPDYPSPPSPLWFRDPGFSNFGVVDAAAGRGARIAHLDTGYDPSHSTLPPHLDKTRQKNFVDAATPNDATDTASGPTAQHGHGTATLALLASDAYGGAPGAEVVPMRVADSVVLFSNSSVARAFDEVHRLTVGGGAAAVDVVSMSMGGLASQAWAEAINALYDAGVFVVTAAGNNYSNLPTRFIVYPARFDRVVAACGVMSDGRPYADLPPKVMAGDYGPSHKMATAIAAATPNVPWARFGCPQVWDPMGGGTSSATPQVAAAATLWIAKNRAGLNALPQPWMRVEAVRHALFSTVHAERIDHERLGRGRLDVGGALAVGVASAATLVKTAPDSASWGFFRVLTGLGLAVAVSESDPTLQQLELEALQVTQRFAAETVVDWSLPPEAWSPTDRRRLAQAIADRPEASEALKSALRSGAAAVTPAGDTVGPAPEVKKAAAVEARPALDPMTAQHLRVALKPEPPTPRRRRLRAYAYDPVSSGDIDRYGLNEAALDVRWETDLAPGPVGEYLEVIDIDPASGCAYAPVDLSDPRLIATDGLSPNESEPQFHQQMVYAVAMKTIEHFELALGRVALWAPAPLRPGRPVTDLDKFVPRLRIYPHAIREENAFYSPERSALLFGYFNAQDHDTGEVLPGGVVHACLSHDVVAHETTHALLDGLHRYFREATNPDALAFHEAFADIVALFQHFTVPEALRAEIAKSQGRIERQNMLGQLAMQFGEATGNRGALRSYIGEINQDTGVWELRPPRPTDYKDAAEAHARGAVLVSAVFEAFLTVYRMRSIDLVRLATGGTGVLPEGDAPADLVQRLTLEATRVAAELLQVCIRALDYCPPVDVTFGDYLRAVITADKDVSTETRREYRIALIAAFRARGIYPEGLKSLSPTSVAWDPPPIPLQHLEAVIVELDESIQSNWTLATERAKVWEYSRGLRRSLQLKLSAEGFPQQELDALGLVHVDGKTKPLQIGDVSGELHGLEVHSARPARRIDADGQARTDLVVEITQKWSTPPFVAGSDTRYEHVRGGCTLLFDMETRQVRYLVRKRLQSPGRVDAQLGFKAAAGGSTLRGAYWSDDRVHGEPFAVLHGAL